MCDTLATRRRGSIAPRRLRYDAGMRPPIPLLLLGACLTTDKNGGPAKDTAASPLPSVVDADADGSPVELDCDDTDPLASPTAMETCDGVDNNCDGQIDEGVTTSAYLDADLDGFGDPDSGSSTCTLAEGEVTNALDCDDADATVHPGALDRCDEQDEDCDGELDEDEAVDWYADADGDTYGLASAVVTACLPADGYAAVAGDCDDDDASVFPGRAEACDERDNDCDGAVDEGVTRVFYADYDGDGWGRLDQTAEACLAPTGYAEETGDCDDADNAVFPYAPEADCTDPKDYNCDRSVAYADADADGWAACVDCDDANPTTFPGGLEQCNGADDDCDGAFDDADPSVDLSTGITAYLDADADGHGDPATAFSVCALPAGAAATGDDCDDTRSQISPSASERCNGEDDDCDALTALADPGVDLSTATAWYRDIDNDGYGNPAVSALSCGAPSGYRSNALDCNDNAAAISPAAAEVCDGMDNDCDSSADEGFQTPASSVVSYAPGPSCNANYNRLGTISVCGCAPVYIVGTFYDAKDGSAGQATAVTATANSMTLTWDDCASGCDCDLDIKAATSWTATKTGTLLSVTVTHAIQAVSTGHAVLAGYWITGYGYAWLATGTSTQTYTYACTF